MHEYEYKYEHPASARPADSRRRRGTDLEHMVLAELQQVATGLGIKDATRIRKSALIDRIRAAQGEQAGAVTRTRRRTAAPARPPVPSSPPSPTVVPQIRGRRLEEMVLAELQQIASALGIRGTARMRKSELIRTIRDRLREQAAAPTPQDADPQPDPADRAAARHAADIPPRRTRFTTLGIRAISLGTQLLPAAARERWQEEWKAEWADLAERPGRTRLMYLVRITAHSAPRLAWSLRRASRREAA
ncbi:Rho termination factor N-terminal domain-containing protein [Streptomyces sp. NPDC006140]|uniref:Rho termination factor N-terminal domain-containing protein n=2 Tax=unclassified Streptomyces TaxID=2593676 RepID=UPI0034063288